jgi:hypothetical protein
LKYSSFEVGRREIAFFRDSEMIPKFSYAKRFSGIKNGKENFPGPDYFRVKEKLFRALLQFSLLLREKEV